MCDTKRKEKFAQQHTHHKHVGSDEMHAYTFSPIHLALDELMFADFYSICEIVLVDARYSGSN